MKERRKVMYLRYTEDPQDQKTNNNEYFEPKPKVKKKEMSKSILIICLGLILYLLEYTKQHGYFTSTEEQFVLAFVSAVVLKFIVERISQWISK